MGKVVRMPGAADPIVIGCYTLTDTGLEVSGQPTFAEHESVGEFIRRVHKASPWWVVDWLAYAESRAEWRERREQLVDAGVYAEKTIRNMEYIGRRLPKSRRRDNIDFTLHAEVASLEPAEQEEFLDRVEEEGLSRIELRKEIRAHKRTAIIEGQAVLEGMYRVLYADPPWLYSDSGPTADGSLAKAERHFPGMTPEALAALPVEAHALPDSVLWMWSTSSFLPIALQLGEHWGFTYKTSVVWDKVLGNYGHYVRVHHELLLIFTRGSCLPDAPTPMPDSVQTIRRGDEHSGKPEEFRQLITKLYTRGPYLELFGRKPCQGWSVFGNDARLWAEHARASA